MFQIIIISYLRFILISVRVECSIFIAGFLMHILFELCFLFRKVLKPLFALFVLFATIRHYSHYSYYSYYSRLFAIRYSGFPDTLHGNLDGSLSRRAPLLIRVNFDLLLCFCNFPWLLLPTGKSSNCVSFYFASRSCSLDIMNWSVFLYWCSSSFIRACVWWYECSSVRSKFRE